MKTNQFNATVPIRFEQLGRRKGGGRIALLDELRGLAIVNMVAYHLCYDLVDIFGFDWPWFFSKGAGIWQEYIALSFLSIAGICTRFSGRAYVRTLKIALCAALITLATYFIYPDQTIVFGILHCMAAAMLVYALFQRQLENTPPFVGLAVSLLLMLLTWNVANGWLGIGGLRLPLPDILYRAGFLFPLGFSGPDFRSADYFPLFPYLFVFLAGGFAGEWIKNIPAHMRREHIVFLAFIGRYSLLVYMLHQPVLFGVLSLLL
ncbi:MAG: DUF1624 domain-containing protein [Clostridiales Family XIII bacterium]|jgi:uncharacterized membrane protein|nr:DUF1624 domain-containing protein [Clostridiales Family XIII bacterium]